MPQVKRTSKSIDSKSISIRFRIDFGGACSVGFGKIALLEAIACSGSLSKAALQMGMSYRHAWELVDSMNTSFDERVVTASVGGNRGGGATLTEFGNGLVQTLRGLETKLAAPAQKHLAEIAKHVIADKSVRVAKRAASNRVKAIRR